MLKDISHIAIAVNNLDRACAFYRDIMGGEIVNRHVMPQQKVEVAFVKFGGRTKIELLCPTEDDSPVGRYLAKHGPGLHHVCFRARTREDVDAAYEFLKSIGAKIVHPPEEGPWFPGYYSLLFEDPDGIRLELNYVPMKGFLGNAPAQVACEVYVLS